MTAAREVPAERPRHGVDCPVDYCLYCGPTRRPTRSGPTRSPRSSALEAPTSPTPRSTRSSTRQRGCSVRSVIVFLDIDGVLNHQQLYDANLARGTPTPPDGWIDRACVARLNELCARTGASVVISSSWRTYASIPGQPVGGFAGTVGVLRACGLTAEVIGATPDHATPEMRAQQERAPRWPEIRAWLEAHPAARWVVLDDSEIPGTPEDRFVRTDIAVGLTDDDCERAARALDG